MTELDLERAVSPRTLTDFSNCSARMHRTLTRAHTGQVAVRPGLAVPRLVHTYRRMADHIVFASSTVHAVQCVDLLA